MADKQEILKKTSIGGQALIEGVMMRGPEKTAMAVRTPTGEIAMEEWKNPVNHRPAFTRWPFVRGLFNFIDSMKIGYKCLMRSAELSGLDDEDDGKAWTVPAFGACIDAGLEFILNACGKSLAVNDLGCHEETSGAQLAKFLVNSK